MLNLTAAWMLEDNAQIACFQETRWPGTVVFSLPHRFWLADIRGEEAYNPLPFSFELIEWTSGPVAVLPFVGNSAVPRARSACCNHAERPEIVSLLPEDLQNKLAWE